MICWFLYKKCVLKAVYGSFLRFFGLKMSKKIAFPRISCLKFRDVSIFQNFSFFIIFYK